MDLMRDEMNGLFDGDRVSLGNRGPFFNLDDLLWAEIELRWTSAAESMQHDRRLTPEQQWQLYREGHLYVALVLTFPGGPEGFQKRLVGPAAKIVYGRLLQTHQAIVPTEPDRIVEAWLTKSEA